MASARREHEMFERFTDRARRVVVLAQDEARLLDHNYIGTEHLLLGLLQEGHGVAAQALDGLGVSLAEVRRQVEEIIGRGSGHQPGHLPFTPRAKKVLELSFREALKLGHDYIGTEHILLGIVREGEGVAAQVIAALGAGEDQVRDKVTEILGRSAGRPGEHPGETRVFGASPQLGEVISRLRAIENRLAAIERHLGIAPAERAIREPGPAAEPGGAPEQPGERPEEPGAAAAE
jgi:ATP-dependent Clp protease ATP-binding subunit ClpC